jgi:hypothetical protein
MPTFGRKKSSLTYCKKHRKKDKKKIIKKDREKKVIKGTRRMPWLLKAMKDVISCDKPGGGANIHYIPGFPNGETRLVEDQSLRSNTLKQTR